MKCVVCNSEGFAPSLAGKGCTFCDGTDAGQVVTPAAFLLVSGPALGDALSSDCSYTYQEALAPKGCLLMDDLSKLVQLDGSLPLVAVPQDVLARLMAGANAAVEMLHHQELVRAVLNSASLTHGDAEIKRRVILKGRTLENAARLAHGLPALPTLEMV